MKILSISYLFPNSYNSGFGIFVLNRLKAITRYCEIIVINPIPWFPFCHIFERYRSTNKIPKKEIIEGIIVFHPRFFIIPRFFKALDCFSFLFSIFFLTKKIHNNYKFDLIDLHWTYPDILSGKFLSIYFKKKFIITVRGKAALNIFPSIHNDVLYQEKSLRTLILKHFLRKADSLITLSRELKTICLDYNVPGESVKVIPNGVNTNNFFYLNQATARRQLKLSENKKIVLSVGNLIFGKGFDLVINGLPDVIKLYPDFLYCIIGSHGAAGDYRKELMDLIRLKKLTEFVIFVGQVEHTELLFWYNAADMFCLPSRGEGCPNVLLEALACGCPSLSANVGDVNSFLEQPYMGKLVNTESLEIKNGILDMLTDRFDRKMIAEHMKQFSWDVCAKKVVENYIEVVGN